MLLVHPPELLILLAFAGNCNSSRVFEKKKKDVGDDNGLEGGAMIAVEAQVEEASE